MNIVLKRFISLILIVSFTTVSCMANHEIRPTQIAPKVLKPGDGIQVVTKDSKSFRFKVKEITPDAIVGKNITVKIDDISRIWKRKLSLWRTVGLAGIITASVLFVALIIALQDFTLFPQGL